MEKKDLNLKKRRKVEKEENLLVIVKVTCFTLMLFQVKTEKNIRKKYMLLLINKFRIINDNLIASQRNLYCVFVCFLILSIFESIFAWWKMKWTEKIVFCPLKLNMACAGKSGNSKKFALRGFTTFFLHFEFNFSIATNDISSFMIKGLANKVNSSHWHSLLHGSQWNLLFWWQNLYRKNPFFCKKSEILVNFCVVGFETSLWRHTVEGEIWHIKMNFLLLLILRHFLNFSVWELFFRMNESEYHWREREKNGKKARAMRWNNINKNVQEFHYVNRKNRYHIQHEKKTYTNSLGFFFLRRVWVWNAQELNVLSRAN